MNSKRLLTAFAFVIIALTVSADELPADSLRFPMPPCTDITQEVRYGHRTANRQPEDIDIIVLHSNYHDPSFCEPADTFSTEGCLAQFRYYRTAPHYMVCRNAEILRMVSEKDVAWQAGRSALPGTDRTMLNGASIGIEVVSTKTNGPTQAQYRALIALVKNICQRNSIRYIVRHADIAPDRRDDPWGFDWPWFADQIQQDFPEIEIPRTPVQEIDELR